MSASVYSENEYVRIWTDDFSPCIFAQIRTFPSSDDELKKIKAHKTAGIRALLKKYGAAYSIFDVSETTAPDAVTLMKYCSFYVAEQFLAGLEYKAFLKPEDPIAADSLEKAITSLPAETVGIFDTFDDAFQHITRLWQEKSKEDAEDGAELE